MAPGRPRIVPPSRFRGPAAVMLGVCMTACASEPPPPPSFSSERDSLGVTIVESSAPLWSDSASASGAWTVSAAPALDLSTTGTGPEHELFGVSGAVRYADGRIAVAQGMQILVYSPEGVHLQTLTRPGEGPGGYSRPPSLRLRHGDSLVAYDFRPRRFTIYGPDLGEPTVVQIAGGSYYEPSTGDRGDDFVVMGVGDVPNDAMPEGLSRGTVSIRRVSRDGRLGDTLATTAGAEMLGFETGGRVLIETAVFGRRSHLAMDGERIIVGDSDELDYRVLDAKGTVTRIVRGTKDLTLGSSEIMAERRALIGSDSTPAHVKSIDDMILAIPASHRRPAYRNLIVDATGAVWLQDFFESTVPAQVAWEVFDRDGRWLGPVMLPGSFRVYQIGADWVLGVLTDELGVERVQVRPLARP